MQLAAIVPIDPHGLPSPVPIATHRGVRSSAWAPSLRRMSDSGRALPGPWLKRLLLLVLVVAGYLALRFTVLADDPIEVRVVAVEHGLVEATVTNSKAGTVRARLRASVTAETGGRVVEVARREGDAVTAGDVIVRLNDASHLAQLELSRQGVRVARAGKEEACLRKARAGRELARMQKLQAQRIVSEDVLDELQYAADAARVACQSAASELERALASVNVAEAELAKTLILAPFDGVVAEVSTEVGEWVTPSPPLLTSPAVVDLIDPTSVYISAPMDEVDSGRIHAGQRAKVTVDSLPDQEFAGRVLRVAPYVMDLETQNRTVEIEVALDDTEVAAGLLPGTSADVEIVLDEHADVPRIPTSALLEGNKVLVLREDVLAEEQVELGLRNWKYAELSSGLEIGDRVVTSLDRVEVKSGARAVIAKEAAEPAS
jgi:HlyD family secretion protein